MSCVSHYSSIGCWPQIGDLAKILTTEYGRVGGSPAAELLDCLAHGGRSAPLELWLGRSIIAEGQVGRDGAKRLGR
jgi:hypothetical protein